MKQFILFILFILGSFEQAFALDKAVNWRCEAAFLQPTHYKATLRGPDKSNYYRLNFTYMYYGAELNYDYKLKKIQNAYIGQKARVYKLVPQKNKTVRLYIETEKHGPVDMICM